MVWLIICFKYPAKIGLFRHIPSCPPHRPDLLMRTLHEIFGEVNEIRDREA